jgi:apolipoprotein N-acyltransferase
MLKNLLKRLAPAAWLVPGFLLWASYPPMGEKTDALFALAPLMWLARNAEPGRAAKKWFLNGLFFWICTLNWMPAIVKNGGPWPLVVLGWWVLALYCSLYFAAFGWLSAAVWERVRERSYVWRILALAVAEPVLWAGLEIVRSRLFGGFAWNQLGVVLSNSGFGAPAAFGGVYLLSAVAVLSNGLVVSVVERMLAPLPAYRRIASALSGAPVETEGDFAFRAEVNVPRWVRTLETAVPVAMVAALYFAAAADRDARLNSDASEGGRVVSFALVQRNFPCAFSAADEKPEMVYAKMAKGFKALKPDVMVLPESAFSEIGPLDKSRAVWFAGWLMSLCGADAVIGGGSRTAAGNLYNSVALYSRDFTPQYYDKVHLVPFGEYIPGDKVWKWLQRFAPVGSCTPGELKTLEWNGVKIGMAICFEDTDSAQMRKLADAGADLLVMVTNDSWFGGSVEAEQHAWQSVARAAETGLPVVRVGNSGVTGVVGRDGTAFWLRDSGGALAVDSQGSMFQRVRIPEGGPKTVYVRLGDAPLLSAFAALLALLAAAAWKSAKSRA